VKKLFTITLTLVLALSLAACSGNSNNSGNTIPAPSNGSNTTPPADTQSSQSGLIIAGIKSAADTNVPYNKEINAKIGDILAVELIVSNDTGVSIDDVVVQATLPQGLSIVKGSTQLFNYLNTSGIVIGDITDGIKLSEYSDGNIPTNIQYEVKVDDSLEVIPVNIRNDATGYKDGEVSTDTYTYYVAINMVSGGNDPTIVAGLQHEGDGDYIKEITAKPGEIINAKFQVYNTTGREIALSVDVSLAEPFTVVPDSTVLYNITNPDGIVINDLTEWRDIGVYNEYDEEQNVGWATVAFKIQVPSADKLASGTNICNVAVATTGYDEQGNIATDTEVYYLSIVVDNG
jgi:uncharacterized repeat protein (TIGR01451 family)